MKTKFCVEFSSGKSVDESNLRVYVEDKVETTLKTFDGEKALEIYNLLTDPYKLLLKKEYRNDSSQDVSAEEKVRSTPYADIYFREKFIAEVVLFALRSILYSKGFVSVNDLFRLAPQKFEMWRGPLLGWGTLKGVYVERSTNGSYYITLPDPVCPVFEKNEENTEVTNNDQK